MAQYLDKTGLTTLWNKIKNTFALKSHTHSKSEVGLGNVDNTSDADKPVSNATQQALNLKANSNDVYTKSETDNKINEPLYNLGYYDTITANSDGTYTITRQTGYVDLWTLEWNYDTSKAYFYVKYPNIIEPSAYNIDFYGVTSKYTTTSWSDMNSGKDKSICYVVGYIRIKDTSYTDVASFKASLQGVILQYKLATSYTEKVEKNHYATYNQRFILEHNKSEAERSANLLNTFDRSNIPTASSLYNATLNSDGSYTSTKTSDARAWTYSNSDFKMRLTKGTYYLSVTGTISTDYNVAIEIYDNNNKLLVSTSRTNNFKASFNLASDTDVGIIGKIYNSSNIKIMLNEGTTALPYQPYSGKVIHKKDITDLYENAYNLGYYDTISENSDGTYTITRQTGYIVLDGVKHKFSEKSSSTHNGLFYNHDNYVKSNALKPSNTATDPTIICNLFETKQNDYLYNNNEYGVSLYPDGAICVGLTTAITTIDDANAYLVQNPISIQYKLATATTEKVEKNHYATYNQRFILEHNKSEAERSANLFDKDNVAVGDINANDGEFREINTDFMASDYIEIKPNTTYSNNLKIKSFGTTGLAFYDINKTYISGIINNYSAYNKFTTPSNAKYLRLSIDISYSQPYDDINNLMLNEGSIPLPYQPYEGKVVHEKELGGYVTTDTQQTITGYKKISSIGIDTINGATLGNAIIRQNPSTGEVIVGSTIRPLRLWGNQTRPSYSKNDGVSYSDLALLADIPQLKTINGNSIVGSGDMAITADSVFTEVTDVIDTFTINRNGTWLITCLGYNKIYASDNSSIFFYGSALVSMTSAGSNPHICINGTAYACSSAITFITSGIMQVYKKAN